MVDFSIFLNNSANCVNESHGGAFALFDSSLVLLRSNFSYNVAERGSGGVIYSCEADIMLSGNKFSKNSASVDGGVIYLWKSSLNESDSQFIGNTAGDEGGVVFMEESEAEFRGSNMHFRNYSRRCECVEWSTVFHRL